MPVRWFPVSPSPTASVAGVGLEQLYRDHYDEIFRYLLRRCGRREVAADLTHDVFVKVARWADTHRWVDRGRPVVALLTTVAKTIVCDWWRRGPDGRETSLEALRPTWPWLGEGDPGEPVDEQAARAAERGRWRPVLEAAMADLTPRQQQVLNLTYVEGMSQRQIAEQLGIEEGTVKQHTASAMRALRDDPRVMGLGYVDT